ncbi:MULTISPECIES: tRNA uracil 4-sulfurtransferase ThiI [unclassified Enterococcus]|uniref:tRNA uracil 4-sulfurtransferase ThiI n=1 Tax=unclassified Enterococcus TaxID=2608891 RepID=UPI0015530F26|nr:MULTISPECIES: tRNA uracil 4-sulfurtransferase ThiI [unclassified Enterococcus]MBS7576175.1 tRNA 4-thiouridine(8) synthase ThiI [Enterococcus sp. MMGLQ5-2]MBS7583408.1 tRNA 4-thiouridine(8) synthase ThiI [Enterococcus sp. MMGLQ5-1]NPD11268.1 tRNA 4-thiouridine(8) synthase ThiI [Enterococcus sp. MMGLQ5-1]NPD36011.1 tRNA 4-thiouridine(8) synthase ThiI [Enterococcus sp. MMGLQ5-2]
MEYSEILVRYGELSLKGKNKNRFIGRLVANLQASLAPYPNLKIFADRDRTHILLNGENAQAVMIDLKKVFGIQNFSPAFKVDKDIDALKAAVREIMLNIFQTGMTFKISAKRSDHSFEYDTNQLHQILGNAVYDVLPNIQAKMKKPDVNLRVEIRKNAAYLSYETIKGALGLPVGTSGKGMLMLSGGIDSPVAGYLAMKRGVEIEAVHFASPPYTSEGALQKAKDLTQKLTAYSGKIRFIEVPFTEIQETIKAKAPTAYLMTLTRRFMLRVADEIRKERKGLVIINGESLGQVASQTLESMQAINEVTNTPIIRPVVTMDKTEIIEISEAIDTFAISIRPFEDCCTIFAPPSPKTKPNLDLVHRYEARMAVEELVERAVRGIKIEMIELNSNIETEMFSELL